MKFEFKLGAGLEKLCNCLEGTFYFKKMFRLWVASVQDIKLSSEKALIVIKYE